MIDDTINDGKTIADDCKDKSAENFSFWYIYM